MADIAVITRGMLRQEWRKGKNIMGYLLGFAVAGYWMRFFLRYAAETGEPINILETFCVIEQHYVNMLFLILGWLLVVADAPFIKGNVYLLLYRCGRRRWNMGMLSYILVQAFFYTGAMAVFTVVVSSFWGFAGNMWSSPVYVLALDTGNHIGVRYNITFPYLMMMRTMTVPQAFAVIFLFLYLYLAFFGVLLYTCTLALSETWGIVIAAGVHLTGYLRMMDGYTGSSLLAMAVPGNFTDGTPAYWRYAVLFAVLIGIFMVLSDVFIKRAEFHLKTEGDG